MLQLRPLVIKDKTFLSKILCTDSKVQIQSMILNADSKHVLWSKQNSHIIKFFGTDVFQYRNTDFTAGKMLLLKIKHMEIVLPSKTVSSILIDVKA